MEAIPHFAPKAKRVIYLFQNGAPSQLESFDYKPLLNERMGEELPDSIRQGQRLTGMTAGQSSFPLIGSYHGFKQYGASRAWISDLFPEVLRDPIIPFKWLPIFHVSPQKKRWREEDREKGSCGFPFEPDRSYRVSPYCATTAHNSPERSRTALFRSGLIC